MPPRRRSAPARWLADTFAFRAYGRAEAVVPTGVVFVFTSALGVDRNRVLVAALWIGAAIFTIAALRMAHARDDSAWMGKRRQSLWSALPAAVACALFAAPGRSPWPRSSPAPTTSALLDTRNSVTAMSPQWSARSSTSARGSSTAATSSCSPCDRHAAYLAPDRHWPSSTARGGRRPKATVRPADGPTGRRRRRHDRSSSSITDRQARRPRWRRPRSPPVSAAQPTDCCGPTTRRRAVRRSGGRPAVRSGIELTSARHRPVARAAAPGDRRPRAPNPVYYDAARRACPTRSATWPQQVTAQATTPYDQARALQDWFRTNFKYDLTVQRGHSNDAMLNFLSIRKGYCEQFSATFAVMARSPRPADSGGGRVHPGRAARRRPVPRRRPPRPRLGRGVVRRLRLGQLRPDPGRGAPGAEEHTGVAAAQDETASPGGGRATSGPTPPRSASTTTPSTVATTAGRSAGRLDHDDGAGRGGLDRPAAVRRGWLVTLALIVAGDRRVVSGMPRVPSAGGGGGHGPAPDRVVAAWAPLVRILTHGRRAAHRRSDTARSTPRVESTTA